MRHLSFPLSFTLCLKETVSAANTTESGYINPKGQKNIEVTGKLGTDHMQKYYEMRCLNCGFEYKANGSDIWQRKCPKCQGGKP